MTHLLSAFGGFLWIIPVGIAAGIVAIVYNGLQQSKKTGEKYLETGYGKWSVGLTLALIVIIILMYNDR